MVKGFIQKLLIVAFLATTLSLSATVDYQVEHQPQVTERAILFKQKGILKQKDNGYLYVEVASDFIAQILPLIKAEGKIVPPSHYTRKKGIGAHISVMYENERILNEIWQIGELGREFTFSILELRTVKLSSDNKVKKLWLLAVHSPELETLRLRYGLAPKLKGHDFHITIGTQLPGQAQERFEHQEDFDEAA